MSSKNPAPSLEAQRHRLIRSLPARLLDGKLKQVVGELFEYYRQDPAFSEIIDEFQADEADLKHIISQLLACTHTDRAGDFVPIKAVLVAQTLSYLLRGEREQVDKPAHLFAVSRFLDSGEDVFKEESDIRARRHRDRERSARAHTD